MIHEQPVFGAWFITHSKTLDLYCVYVIYLKLKFNSSKLELIVIFFKEIA